MNSFRDLDLELTYDSGTPGIDVVNSFYVPVLERSVRYDRVAGYFSSATFAFAARGIAGLVQNGGRMRLITSHSLTEGDVVALQDHFDSPQLAADLIGSFEESVRELDDLGNAIARRHVAAMCWMLKNGFLEIRIVIPRSANLAEVNLSDLDKFHPKFGVFTDGQDNQIAFSGSINETAGAWSRNIENFDVFPSWFPGRSDYINPRIQRFDQYWNNKLDEKWLTISLPAAVRERLVERYAPTEFPEKLQEIVSTNEPRALRSYQQEALNAWISNNRQGILEMATGTGKTRTARACIESTSELGKLLTIIVVPYQHIAEQWARELSHLSATVVRNKWREIVPRMALEVGFGRAENLTLIAVQNTASSSDFTKLISDVRGDFENFLLVGDEVHWLGARAYQPAMMAIANFRLGLSATPKRYFDDEGSEKIFDYFGETVFQLSLKDALALRDESGNPILCPYEYHPKFLELTEEELSKYRELTKKIAGLVNSKDSASFTDLIFNLRLERSRIVKNAENKIDRLRELLHELDGNITQTLVYCSDLAQLNQAAEVLNEFDVRVQKITGEESTVPTQYFNNLAERQHIIENFAKGNLDVLLAIDCLDEGVDIPSARSAIIMASSGNVKEFIQRRGRVMRPHPGKDRARIYDLCVLPEDPSDLNVPGGVIAVEKKRIWEYAEDALNASEVRVILEGI
jgi:superfamily II DNA or RNA helicase